MSTPYTLLFPTALDDADSLGIASNDAAGTLASPGLAIDGTSLALTVLGDANEFGSSGALVIDDEIIYYTGRSGTTFSGLVRGQEGTSAAVHTAGTTVEQLITAASHTILSAGLRAVETKLGYGAATPTVGKFMVGDTTAGSSLWRILASGDIPDLSATYSVAGHNHSGVYSPVGHSHAISDVTGLQTALDGKQAAFANQNANQIYAGPATGAAATPAFRALVAADIPDLSGVYQPLDGDLTAIAALTTTSFGRSLLTEASAASLTATLSAFVGDSGSGGTKGIVPAPAAGDAAANKYLKADGTWTAVAAGGMSIGGTVTSGTTGSVLFVGAGPVLSQDNSNLFWDNTNDRLGINIGTSPAVPLHVLADASNLGVRVKANAAAIDVDLSSDGSIGFVGTTTNHGFEVWTNASTRIRVDNTGLVGINDATPGAQLSVDGSATGTVTFTANALSGATADVAQFAINGTNIVRFVPVGAEINSVFGDGALATTATDGFIYAPSMAGTPTGVPTSYTGTIPLVVDTTNSLLYARIGGSWVNLSAGGTGLFADGSAASPSISFAADTNTGFYRPIADNVSATVGGTGMMSVTTDGLLVGDVNQFSYYTLYVTGRSNTYAAARIRSVDTPTNEIFQIVRKVGVNDYVVMEVDSFGELLMEPQPRSTTATGTPYARFITPQDTSITASTEAVGIQFGGNSSKATLTRTWATGALTTQRENLFVAPTYSFNGASTVTDAATVAISGPPTAGTNATLTYPTALLVQSGNIKVGASSIIGNIAASTSGFGGIGMSNNGTSIRSGFFISGDTGTFNSNSQSIFHWSNGFGGPGGLYLAASRVFGFDNDVFMRRGGAANLVFGAADAASPVAQTISVQNATGTNVAGVAWTRDASRGTGTAAGGRHVWRTAPAGSSGSSQNALVEACAIESSGTFKFKTFAFSALPTAVADGEVFYCSDGAVTSGADNTLTSGGSGALAVRINGIWRAFNAQN